MRSKTYRSLFLATWFAVAGLASLSMTVPSISAATMQAKHDGPAPRPPKKPAATMQAKHDGPAPRPPKKP